MLSFLDLEGIQTFSEEDSGMGGETVEEGRVHSFSFFLVPSFFSSFFFGEGVHGQRSPGSGLAP
jgi:hypothetical protein